MRCVKGCYPTLSAKLARVRYDLCWPRCEVPRLRFYRRCWGSSGSDRHIAKPTRLDPVWTLGESDGLDDRRHKPRRRELLNQVVRLLFRNTSPGGSNSTAHLLGLFCCYAKLISQKFGLQLHHFVYVLGIH
jgi:hypothetical protein